ncbi:AraC family transcriptional regulator [Duganella sp. FT3S]|uniref:AraC family transcriptional regulator n=1 Tax=Rugamonas fusca TaxID=2758568 RepID=A0A7W2EIC6_9BURK|nr:AraC family transcriptional regulator [Rugamonas fusca]MBA5606431.1 AraC family transcriptional regulator [Rugamonas fusca]
MTFMRAAVLANFPDVARQLGLDPETELHKVGLSLEYLTTPDRHLPSDDVVRLIEDLAKNSSCDTVGLRLSQPRSMSGFGVVGLVLAQQPTLRAALQMVLRYLPLINESLALRLELDGEVALLTEEILTTTVMPVHQSVELALASNLKLFRTLLGAEWSPRCIYFRHGAPRSLELHNQIFHCRCVFNSEFNGMSFPAYELDRPNTTADPDMAHYAEHLIGALPDQREETTTMRVRRLLHLFMPLQRAGIRPVAEALKCSVRKLQLDLAAEHTNFGDLLNQIRRERAKLYLQHSRYSIDQVASLLGYTQPTSFTRWFLVQHGLPPSTWRRHCQLNMRGGANMGVS